MEYIRSDITFTRNYSWKAIRNFFLFGLRHGLGIIWSSNFFENERSVNCISGELDRYFGLSYDFSKFFIPSISKEDNNFLLLLLLLFTKSLRATFSIRLVISLVEIHSLESFV